MKKSILFSLKRCSKIVPRGSSNIRALSVFSNRSLKLQHRKPATSFLPPSIVTRNYCDDSSRGEAKESSEVCEDVVLVEKMEKLHIMTIGINRPDKRNAVDSDTAERLKEIFIDFESDENMHCAVLHGLGGNFCAGHDLEELSELEDDISNKIAELLMDKGAMGPTKMDLTKPVIAAINGYCVGGGLELAIMCDLRVLEDNSKLGFLNRRFGVPLIDGGTVRLPALIGLSRALDLILTGRVLDPKEALDWGLVNRVVTTGTAFGQAMNLAKEIVKFPQECLRADRHSTLYATFRFVSVYPHEILFYFCQFGKS